MEDLVPSIIGGAITALIALIGVAFSYGRLSQRVDDLKFVLAKLEQRFEGFEARLIAVEKAVARVEGALAAALGFGPQGKARS